ncbi:16S rRNA (uracil(1498)-N(3))-methyltransferase [Rasiella rasia]|uniref:Ribosomal RNA small subunit methyltransferase E n=1 Tax=Rasiella rasia TaxID=2744027 RepID=A0A6G6GJ77_9FLAO|nr:16S rRNA (uracil(1498)-N(3))-methyltransferase [Rasiella rasia]QIE58473.1 16S rRNA (uracil(1498)-N(3))-methyltransferase [Rasiella rasia]
MNLFYHPNSKPTDTEISFDKEESRHIGKVLRKQVGDILHTTNGNGSIFEAKLEVVTPKTCLASVLNVINYDAVPYNIHLAVAPTKLNDRYEWFLEKATEIGVSEITPIICDHSERKVIKSERYEKILQSAMKQSLKAYVPKLNAATPFSEFILKHANDEGIRCIAHCEETNKHSLKDILLPKTTVLICIGPEGDFSSSEIDKALQHNFTPVHLGNSRLRTETAAVVACHSVAFINET